MEFKGRECMCVKRVDVETRTCVGGDDVSKIMI